MKVLVLNCGSSSIKYQVYAMPDGDVLAKGLVERIGEPTGVLQQQSDHGELSFEEVVPDHAAGLRRVVEMLTRGESAPLSSMSEIGAVGHRVVHGGEQFSVTTLIDEDVIDAIEANCDLAPLHNPPNLMGIKVAVFDTAFHQTLPPVAYRYAVPRSLYEDAGIRRYGFHGTSHRFVASRAAAMLGQTVTAVTVITCHLGNGSSVAAIARGRSIDTSMGLTPLEGVVMGTRCGDIDAAVVFHLARTRGASLDEIDRLLNKKSGLLGLSGKSNDVRELLRLEKEGDADAALALDVFCYRLKKYIGAYVAALGELDAVVFTAGIGENAPAIRSRVCRGLDILGLSIDEEKNAAAVGREADISGNAARPRVLVVPTDEEKVIAMDTYELAN